MPYLDRWGITVTRVSAGVYEVTLGVKTVTVNVNQLLGTEAINVAAALWNAIEYLTDGDFPDLWRLRYQYAMASWKIAAYNEIINGLPGNQRVPWRAKRDVWVAEEARLKLLMGADA